MKFAFSGSVLLCDLSLRTIYKAIGIQISIAHASVVADIFRATLPPIYDAVMQGMAAYITVFQCVFLPSAYFVTAIVVPEMAAILLTARADTGETPTNN
jgi:hypothetical protein